MKEVDILDRSLLLFEENTGLEIEQKSMLTQVSGERFDAIIKVKKGSETFLFQVEVKHSYTKGTIDLIKTQFITQHPETPVLLVGGHISGELFDHTKNKGLSFIDAAGNAFIDIPGLYIFSKGNKAPSHLKKQRPVRLFQESGLKLLFVLLSDPGLLSQNPTYRELSEFSGISLASVAIIIEEMEEMGFLIKSGTKRKPVYSLRRSRQLLDRWMYAYGDFLRPKVHRGFFKPRSGKNIHQVREIISQMPNEQFLFGGEIAGSETTGFLTPASMTLYSNCRLSEVAKKLTLFPTDQSEIEILEPFWNIEYFHQFPSQKKHLVPPLLIYSDLKLSGKERNIEVADRILYDLPHII